MNTSNDTSGHDYDQCPITNGILRYFGALIFLVGILSTALSVGVFARKPLRKRWIIDEISHLDNLLSSRPKVVLLLFPHSGDQRFNSLIHDAHRASAVYVPTGFDHFAHEHL